MRTDIKWTSIELIIWMYGKPCPEKYTEVQAALDNMKLLKLNGFRCELRLS